MIAHGRGFTDFMALWIKKVYVAGPFRILPLEFFDQIQCTLWNSREKFAPFMNMSSPLSTMLSSLMHLEHLHMATAMKVGYSVVACGHNSLIWKRDMVDTNKHLPASMSDLVLKGLCWLGRYFVETHQVFGVSSAVAAYNRLNHTLAEVAAILAHFPIDKIHRVLDDLPVVRAASEAGHQCCKCTLPYALKLE